MQKFEGFGWNEACRSTDLIFRLITGHAPRMFPVSDFPAVAAVIEDGIARQLHTGIQIYVSRNGLPLLDALIGWRFPPK